MNDETPQPHPDSAEAHLKNEDAEVFLLTDIFMRILAGRSMSVCLTALSSGLKTLALQLPTEGKRAVGNNIAQLGMDILNSADEDEEQTNLPLSVGSDEKQETNTVN